MKIRTMPTLLNLICNKCDKLFECLQKHQKGTPIQCFTEVGEADKFVPEKRKEE